MFCAGLSARKNRFNLSVWICTTLKCTTALGEVVVEVTASNRCLKGTLKTWPSRQRLVVRCKNQCSNRKRAKIIKKNPLPFFSLSSLYVFARHDLWHLRPPYFKNHNICLSVAQTSKKEEKVQGGSLCKNKKMKISRAYAKLYLVVSDFIPLPSFSLARSSFRSLSFFFLSSLQPSLKMRKTETPFVSR